MLITVFLPGKASLRWWALYYLYQHRIRSAICVSCLSNGRAGSLGILFAPYIISWYPGSLVLKTSSKKLDPFRALIFTWDSFSIRRCEQPRSLALLVLYYTQTLRSMPWKALMRFTQIPGGSLRQESRGGLWPMVISLQAIHKQVRDFDLIWTLVKAPLHLSVWLMAGYQEHDRHSKSLYGEWPLG